MFKKKSSKKAGSAKQPIEDTSWIVEGIVEYLSSPTWNVPILNFVESQCGSFTHSEESSFEHTEIHKKYKALVEQLIGAYMKELEITEKQFSSACSPTNRDIAQMHRNFEYIWAADDFLIFKRLMASHNVRLEKEALMMLESNHGKDPSKKFTSEDADEVTKMLKSSKISLAERRSRKVQEEEDFRLAVEFSKMEMERLNSIAEKEKQLLEQAIRLSLESYKSNTEIGKSETSKVEDFKGKQLSSDVGLTKPISVIQTLPTDISTKSLDKPASYQSPLDHKNEISIQQYMSGDENVGVTKQPISLQKVSSSTPTTSSLPPLKSQQHITGAEAANAWLDQAMKGIIDSPKNSALSQNSKDSKYDFIDPEELAKRKAYLQAQRDKLLAQKRKERNEELVEFMEIKNDDNVPKTDAEEEKRLASRRAIAERLKREVINKD